MPKFDKIRNFFLLFFKGLWHRERAKFDKIREKNISNFIYFYKYCDFQNNYNLKDYLLLENCAIAIEQNLTKLEKKIFFIFILYP